MAIKNNIKKALFHTIIFDFAGLFIAIGTSSLLAYKLSVLERGVVATLQAIIACLTVFSSPITAKFELILGKNRETLKKVLVKSSTQIIPIIIFSSLILNSYSILFLKNSNLSIIIYLLINCTLLVQFYSLLFQRLLLAKRQFKSINNYNLLSNIFYFLALLIFTSDKTLSLDESITAYLIPSLTTFSGFYISLNKLEKTPSSTTINYKEINFNKKKNISIFLQDIIISTIQSGPVIIVSTFFGVEMAGLYRIASTFNDLFIKIPRIINFIFKGFGLSKLGGWRRVIVMSNLTYIFILLASLILFFFGNEIIRIIFSEKYISGKNLAVILTFAVAPWSSFHYYLTQLNIKRNYPSVITRFIIYALVIFSPLLYLLISLSSQSSPITSLYIFTISLLLLILILNLLIVKISLSKTKLKFISLFRFLS